MALPVGTTCSTLQSIARWSLAALLLVGMLAWWWPGFLNWGAAAAGLIVVWLMLMLSDIAGRRRTVVGNPLHLGILGVACVVVHHVGQFQQGDGQKHDVGGAMDLSMLFGLACLSLGIFLVQALLARWRHRGLLLAVIGGAMAVASAVVASLARARPISLGMILIGLAGVTLMALSLSLWAPALKRRRGGMAIGAVLVGLPAVAALVACSIVEPLALLASGAIAATTLLMLLTFGRPRWAISEHARIVFLGLLVGFIVAMGWAAWREFGSSIMAAGPLGQGEQALARLSARNSGLEYLSVATGIAGVVWFLLVWVGGLAWLIWKGRRTRPRPIRAALAMTAALLCLGAMLSGGGLFVPLVLLACALTWGLLPEMLGCRLPRRGGWAIAIVTGAVLMILGLMNDVSLFMWAASAFGGSDWTMHGVAGLLLTAVMVWLLGQGRIALGLAVAAGSVFIGGSAELVQEVVGRDSEWSDFIAHSVGACAWVVLYVLAFMSRWAESADVTARTLRMRERVSRY